MRPSIYVVPLLSAVLSCVSGELCTRVQACEAQISRFPAAGDEVGLQVMATDSQVYAQQEASGWGSGMVPLYDELLDEQNPLDYTATPDVTTYSLCDCGSNQTCDSSQDAHNMNLDNSLRLTFCSNVDSQIVNACKGRRGIIRVIGPADDTGNFISAVQSSIVFCSCPTGYQRQQAEVWEAGILSLQYKCV